MARPKKYSEEIADKICEAIGSSSLGLKHLLKPDDMPCPATVYNWLRDYPEFLDKYTRAREDQADFMADEILSIADDASNDFMVIVKGKETYEIENKEVTSRSKLRVEARKWIASKLKPKKYGDKLDVTSGGKEIYPPWMVKPDESKP